MSDWALKRFWTSAEVAPVDAGFAVTLDGRPVKTPAKAPLAVPTEALAREIAAEWDAQTESVDPRTMPFTRSANAAIDKVTIQHALVADMLAEYGDADLLCYRADSPQGLVARQSERWDPLLDWAADEMGVRLVPRTGVMHAPQDADALAELRARVHALDTYALTAMHDLVSMSGSLILAFAALHGHRDPDVLWDLSRLDETWQAEQWGRDDEAEALATRKRGEFLHAHRLYTLTR